MNTSINHDNLPETFAPETVDDEIARYLGTDTPPTETATETASDGRLIHEIAAYHALPPEADVSLAGGRAHLRDAAEALGGGDAGRRGVSMPPTRGERNLQPQPPQPWETTPTPHATQTHRLMMSLSAPVRAVAAVLLVALLLGGFVGVLHLRAGLRSKAAPTWQNVSITRAKAQGKPLDFDPAVGVEYAISQVDGTIYALGANHLWYSVDGGTTYRPFMPALSLPASGRPYAISTVPGLRGVFVDVSGGDHTQIAYGDAGTAKWMGLGMNSEAWVLAHTGSFVTFSGADLGSAIFYEHGYGKSVQARAVGNWIFALVRRGDGDGSVLIGTPDFGTTTYALTATMPGTCIHFAVNPADARQIFCLTSSNTIEQTPDGGQTWKPMESATNNPRSLSTAIWASDRAVYSYTASETEQAALVRHPIGAGDWRVAPKMPTLPEGGGAQVIGVSPDDTVYEMAALEGMRTRVHISALAPGAQRLAPIGNEATLTFPNSAIFFDLGDLYTGRAPALYAHAVWSAQVPGPQPLYRLALPTNDSSQQAAMPFPTPTSFPASTPTSYGPCASTPGDMANIQNGGYGADLDTFAQRWGPQDDTAISPDYFGRWADGTPKLSVLYLLGSNHRVYWMSYAADKAQDMTQAQGQALATSILPKDATPIGRPQQSYDGTRIHIAVTYCSAALIAAFPATLRNVDQLPKNGYVVVTYTLRTDGNLTSIEFGPLP